MIRQPSHDAEEFLHLICTYYCSDEIQGPPSVQNEDKYERRGHVVKHSPTKAK